MLFKFLEITKAQCECLKTLEDSSLDVYWGNVFRDSL